MQVAKMRLTASPKTSSHHGTNREQQPSPPPSYALQPLDSQPSSTEPNSSPPVYTLSFSLPPPYSYHQYHQASHPSMSTGHLYQRPGSDCGQHCAGSPQWQNRQQGTSQRQNGAPQPGYSGQYYYAQPGPHGQWQPGPPPQHMPYVVGYPFPPPPPQRAHRSPMARRTEWRDPVTEENVHQEGWTGFTDKEVRTKFVRKVYIILMLQLLFTMGIIAVFIFEPHVNQFVRANRYLFWMALVIFISVYIGLSCFTSVRRRFPCNVIALSVLTLAMSYQAGTISIYYNTEAVLMAVGICAAVCFAVSIFSYYTKFDFTSCFGILCILSLVLIGFGLIAIFIPSMVTTMIYAALGAVVFTFYLAFDTQMLLGGRKLELSPEEYVFAAVQIYIDIVQIFLYLLLLIGSQGE